MRLDSKKTIYEEVSRKLYIYISTSYDLLVRYFWKKMYSHQILERSHFLYVDLFLSWTSVPANFNLWSMWTWGMMWCRCRTPRSLYMRTEIDSEPPQIPDAGRAQGRCLSCAAEAKIRITGAQDERVQRNMSLLLCWQWPWAAVRGGRVYDYCEKKKKHYNIMIRQKKRRRS